MLFLVDARPPWMSWAPRSEAFRKLVLPCSQHVISYRTVTQGGCWAGLHDPLVALAAKAGASRSVLAERFARFVGEPPMHYLTRWRTQLATRLLAEPGAAKVAAVAEAVGYDSPAAFRRAFGKHVGVAPAAWKRRDTA